MVEQSSQRLKGWAAIDTILLSRTVCEHCGREFLTKNDVSLPPPQ